MASAWQGRHTQDARLQTLLLGSITDADARIGGQNGVSVHKEYFKKATPTRYLMSAGPSKIGQQSGLCEQCTVGIGYEQWDLCANGMGPNVLGRLDQP